VALAGYVIRVLKEHAHDAIIWKRCEEFKADIGYAKWVRSGNKKKSFNVIDYGS
jgi:hypothetical protein